MLWIKIWCNLGFHHHYDRSNKGSTFHSKCLSCGEDIKIHKIYHARPKVRPKPTVSIEQSLSAVVMAKLFTAFGSRGY